MAEQKPIFFLFTRSFWLAFIGGLALLMGDVAAMEAVVELISLVVGSSPEPILVWVKKLAPLVLFLAAFQQRAHAARPYSANPKDT